MIRKMLSDPGAYDFVMGVVASIKNNMPVALLVEMVMEQPNRASITFALTTSDWPQVKEALIKATKVTGGSIVPLLGDAEKKMLEDKKVEKWWKEFTTALVAEYNAPEE